VLHWRLKHIVLFWMSPIQYVKSKGVPQQAEVAQGVPGRLRPRIFFTFRHYKGGSSSVRSTGRLYPRRNPWYSLLEAESTSGHMVLSGVPRKKSPVTPLGIDPGTVRLVPQCLNHYATPGPKHSMCLTYNALGLWLRKWLVDDSYARWQFSLWSRQEVPTLQLAVQPRWFHSILHGYTGVLISP